MLLSLWAHRYLIDQGYLDRGQESSIYAAFLVPAFARLRAGLASTASQGSTYVLNHMLESGAFRVDASHRVVIDGRRARDSIVRASREFIALMAAGNAAAVKVLLTKHIVVRPEVTRLLAQLGSTRSDYLPLFPTADLLETD